MPLEWHTTTPAYVVGLDLGQAADPSALVVVKPSTDRDPVVDVVHIERLPLRTSYTDVAAHTCGLVARLRQQPTPVPEGFRRVVLNGRNHLVAEVVYPNRAEPTPEPRPRVVLAIDNTGVGRAVSDLIIAARPDATLLLVTITGGEATTRDERGAFHVPKRELVSVVQVLLQDGRLRIAATLPMASLLTEELVGFRAKIGSTGHVTYEAGADWRSAPHDDLVLALALACWCCGRMQRRVRVW